VYRALSRLKKGASKATAICLILKKCSLKECGKIYLFGKFKYTTQSLKLNKTDLIVDQVYIFMCRAVDLWFREMRNKFNLLRGQL